MVGWKPVSACLGKTGIESCSVAWQLSSSRKRGALRVLETRGDATALGSGRVVRLWRELKVGVKVMFQVDKKKKKHR